MEYLIALVTGQTIVNPPEWFVAGYFGMVVGFLKLTADSITGALIDWTAKRRDNNG